MSTTRLERIRSLLCSNEVSSVTLSDGTAFLVDPGRMKVARFNDSAAVIVDVLRRGASTEEELVSGVLSVFDVGPDEVRREVDMLLTTLEAELLGPSGT